VLLICEVDTKVSPSRLCSLLSVEWLLMFEDIVWSL
jgi:hypothetical protein